MTNPVALHEVMDEAKLSALVESMEKYGWKGDPILVDDSESNEPQAINGSHRIAAANIAGIDVPMHGLEDSGVDVEALFFDCFDDQDRLDVISGGLDDEAIEIMQREFDKIFDEE